MKIYFSTSPRSLKKYDNHVKKIYQVVASLGYKHTTDFIVKIDPKKFYDADNEEIIAYYKSTTRDLRKADIVLLEMSMHSLAVGHLANLAISLGKPVIALHTKGNTPYFLQGLEDDKLQIIEYDLMDVEEALKHSLEYAADAQDTRFNFFISPKHQNYLDWIARKKKTPRAVHLRKLLEVDITANKEYRKESGGGGKGKK